MKNSNDKNGVLPSNIKECNEIAEFIINSVSSLRRYIDAANVSPASSRAYRKRVRKSHTIHQISIILREGGCIGPHSYYVAYLIRKLVAAGLLKVDEEISGSVRHLLVRKELFHLCPLELHGPLNEILGSTPEKNIYLK